MKSEHIVTLKKQLDKADIKHFCHEIDDQPLINTLEYHNIKRDTKKRHKRNYMGFGSRLQSHKAKLNKETNDDTFRCLQNPGTPEGHGSTTPHSNFINKFGQKVYNQGDVDYDKQTYSFNNP